MLSCKEVSRLLSESLDHDLSRWQRISLWMHSMMCRLCGGYCAEMKQLLRAVQQHDTAMENTSFLGEKLTPEARLRIRRALQEEGNS